MRAPAGALGRLRHRVLPASGVALALVVGAPAALVLVGSGCTKNDPGELITTGGVPCPDVTNAASATASSSGATTTSGSGGSGGGTGGSGGSVFVLPMGTVLDDRVVDYNEALRTASFKLVGNAPTLQQILDLKAAANPGQAYSSMIDQMMADPRFAARMIAFWQSTMRMGGPAAGGKPSRNTAPTFAARLMFEGRPYTDLFTAAEHTCPTFDGTAFADGECMNGPTSGVLTDPGVHAQYYGAMAFRRDRFFQETFACRRQPSEIAPMPTMVGGASYTSPWPFASISGLDNGGTVDFHDLTSAVCANCHATSNHRAPLFANHDENGQYQMTIQVHVPLAGSPIATMGDWLPQTPTPEPTAWKFGVPVADLPALGVAMSKDPEIINCGVRRMWDYAMSKGDVVVDAADVPDSIVNTYLTQFKANGYDLREVLREMVVSPDFVRF